MPKNEIHPPIEELFKTFLTELLSDSDSIVSKSYFEAIDYLTNLRRQIHSKIEVDNPEYLATNVAPLLEIALAWRSLKDNGVKNHFMNHCKSRVKHSNDFRGTVFEILTASRIAISYSSWDWAEHGSAASKSGKSLVDFWVKTENGTVAIECYSRHPESKIDLRYLQQTIEEKEHKFSDLSYLPQPIINKIIFYEATRPEFYDPSIAIDLDRLKIPGLVGCVSFAWRELMNVDHGFSFRPRYHWIGEPLSICSFAVEVRYSPERVILFARKYTEPEPSWGSWGPEERIP